MRTTSALLSATALAMIVAAPAPAGADPLAAADPLSAAGAARAAAYPQLRSVQLTDADPAVTPGRCVQVAMTARIAGGDEPWSDITSTVTRDELGAVKETLGLRIRESGTGAAVSDRVRLCGLDSGGEPDWTGRYTWTVALEHAGGRQIVTRSFRLRYQGVVHLNAKPEPVRRGGWVTLNSWVSDNWEYSDHNPIRFYFRGMRATKWTFKGAVRPRCTFGCGEVGVQSWEVTKRFRQYRSGVWRAVSTRTSYLETGSHSDQVSVRG